MNTDQVVQISKMTWQQVERRLESVGGMIIPIGSTEQHGPHLHLCTDTTRANKFSIRLARELFPQVLVAPPIPVGISEHHMDFPGSMTLRPQTLVDIIIDYVSSLHRHGIENFFIISGHGGNHETIGVAVENIRRQLGLTVPHVNYKNFTSDVTKQIIDTQRVDHAGEWEVADAMFLAPELVEREMLSEGGKGKAPWKYTDLDSEFRVHYPMCWKALTANGAMGDARKATPEKGKIINDAALKRAKEFLVDFMKEETSEN